MPTRRPRSVAVAVAVAALVVLGGCSTGTPPPSGTAADQVPTSLAPVPDDQKAAVFSGILARRAITVAAPGAVGSRTCGAFDRATPAPTIVADTQASTGTTPDQAGYIVGAAVATYCPQHLGDLRSSIG